VRAAVIDGMGPAGLADADRAAADLLTAHGVERDVLVPHLLAAAPRGDSRVVDALRAAAREAFARGAPDTAARYLLRASPPSRSRGLRRGSRSTTAAAGSGT
jgi:hypothetical protein